MSRVQGNPRLNAARGEHSCAAQCCARLLRAACCGSFVGFHLQNASGQHLAPRGVEGFCSSGGYGDGLRRFGCAASERLAFGFGKSALSGEIAKARGINSRVPHLPQTATSWKN